MAFGGAPPPPVPVPAYGIPPSRTEAGLRYVSYAILMFLATTGITVGVVIALFPLIAQVMSLAGGGPPADPTLFFGTLAGLLAAVCVLLILSLIGAIIGLIGLVNVHKGKHEFGANHSRFAERGLVALVLGIIIPTAGQAAITSTAFLSPGLPVGDLVPFLDPGLIAAQLVVGVLEVVLVGLFLLWTIDSLVSPVGRRYATVALGLGLVAAFIAGIGGILTLSTITFPIGPEDISPLLLVPFLVSTGFSFVSLSLWYLAYRDVLERFSRRELVAAPSLVYYPAYPYYPPASPPPSGGPASPSTPQKPPGS